MEFDVEALITFIIGFISGIALDTLRSYISGIALDILRKPRFKFKASVRLWHDSESVYLLPSVYRLGKGDVTIEHAYLVISPNERPVPLTRQLQPPLPVELNDQNPEVHLSVNLSETCPDLIAAAQQEKVNVRVEVEDSRGRKKDCELDLPP